VPVHRSRAPFRRPFVVAVSATLLALGLAPAGWAAVRQLTAEPAVVSPPPVLPALDLSAANRRAPIAGLPDWSKAGFRGGQPLPGATDINPSATCQITAAQLGSTYHVVPNDNVDDTAGIQSAIDYIRSNCSPSANYNKLSLITFPAGTINVSHEISADADYLVLRGAGSDPSTGTAFVYRPDANTLYDTLTPDGSDWDQDAMTYGDGTGGWLWPGRGLFRAQSRLVDPSYQSEWASAPANRKDIFQGTVNVHWKVGVKLRGKPGDTNFAARTGDTVVYLATNGSMTNLKVGSYVNMRAANSINFFQSMDAISATYPVQNLHMRQQIFTIVAADTANHTITLDKPLEYDMPVDSTSDGSPPIDGSAYPSKASPLVDPVVGVGFENFYLTQDMPGLNAADAVQNYGNMAPAAEMHGIVFKWAVNDWVRGIRTYLTGSHPIVTEEAKNLQIEGNYLDGSWNKGTGGNGYFRGSRVWDSLYDNNVTRNLRHFTFQWSASDNVVIGNDFDSDINLHGGYERRNLFELNTLTVPYDHRSGNCQSNCGEEGGGGPDDSNWFPIYWTAGQKGVKWSAASGYQNVFFDNTMTKQLATGGPYLPYYPDKHTIYQFAVAGPSGGAYHLLDVGGVPITDWAHNEQRDYTGGHGVDASRTDPGASLFLKTVGPPASTSPSVPPSPTVSPSRSVSPSPSPSVSVSVSPSRSASPSPSVTPPAGGLTASFAQKSVWSTGYGAAITITNRGTGTVTHWTVSFDLPSGSSVSSLWDGSYTKSGNHYTVVNASYNGTIKPNGTESFGFNVSGTGTPTNITVS
jgi:Cellulose binding domain